MTRKIAFLVEFDMPRSSTVAQCREYIKTALLAECGLRNPDRDPMSDFPRTSLAVSELKTEHIQRGKEKKT